MYVNQTTFIGTVFKCFDVTDFSGIPAEVPADRGPIKGVKTVVDNNLHCCVVGGLMWLARATRPDTANAAQGLARQAHDSCERR